MTRHAKPTRMLRPLNKRQWMKIAAVVAAAGLLGAAGPMYLTMKKIRHKTKHKKFMLGLPAEVLLHLLIIAAAVYFSLS